MSQSFYAHISEDGQRKQEVLAHLQKTADKAAEFAAPFHGEEQAYLAGLLHDIGKYSDAFQRRLAGSPVHVDHSTAGAQEAFRMRQPEVAFAVAGHHGGLPDLGGKWDHAEPPTLKGRMKRQVEPYEPWKEELCLPEGVSRPSIIPGDGISTAFYIRMLYSCLVDADYLDTESFMNDDEKIRKNNYSSIPELFQKLERYIARWQNPEKPLNQRRTAILQACLRCGQAAEKGLYTLTVPTGGGKTVSSLAFALSMARANKMSRVIYVIPYTSIIDQNAEVFSDILGEENVLEHHSGAEYAVGEDASPTERRKALSVENWDAPVVVTTAVQFFESLFANRSSRCRKLHNISDSVVILDEAQSLPTPLLLPCVSAIAQLVLYYGVTAVLCTATQPALEPLFAKLAPRLKIQEICPNPDEQYEYFKRTTLKPLEELTQEELIGRLNSAEQVLCVVNRRRTAQKLYDNLPKDGSYCLTTLLCPADRKRQLQEIRDRLDAGLPCRVVSTSLIEAGVDVDFPVVYRELAGLDSILQTAGRCNREGKAPAENSPVYIFRLAGQKELQMLQQNIDAVKYTMRRYTDLSAPEAIRRYFTFYRNLVGEEQLDKSNIMEKFRAHEYPFARVAKDFRLIEQESSTVYIPRDKGQKLIERLRRGEYKRSIFRQLGQYGVNVYPDDLKELENAGLIERLDENLLVLTDLNAYDPHIGLRIMNVESGEDFFV